MSNINLNNYYQRVGTKRSSVDSKLVVRNDGIDQETYNDLKLDLECGVMTERPLNAKKNGNDLQRLVDAQSVISSVRNILNTTLCSRLLNPEIQLDIGYLLFEPVDKHKAWFIAYRLYIMLPLYEPRVSIENINIVPRPEDSLYEVTLSLTIPSLGNMPVRVGDIILNTI